MDRLSWSVAAVTVAALACAIVQLAWIQIPAMLDYVNHLSRMYLLSGASSPAYVVRFHLCTDLAMDLLVPAMAPLVGVQTASKLFLALSQVLVVSGSMALEWSTKRRQRLGGPGALLVLFTLPFAWGLMNFMFGLGLAAWGVALWVGLRDRRLPTRWLAHAAVVALLFISHVLDLGIYGLTIGLFELSRMRARPSLKALAGLAAFMASPVALAMALAAVGAGGGVGQPVFRWDSFDLKLRWAFVFMNVYDTRLAVLTAAALLAVLCGLAATGRLTLTRAGVWIAGGYVATYLLLPRMMFNTQYQDVRLLTAAGMILPAFMQTRLCTPYLRRTVAAVLAAIVAVNYASVGEAWACDQTDYRQIGASFKQLPRGARVMVGIEDAADRAAFQPLYYAPTLAAPARGAFVFNLYSLPGMQPVEPRADLRHLSPIVASDYKPPHRSVLEAAARGDPSAPDVLRRWTKDYGYLYLIGRPRPGFLPGRVALVAQGRNFVLYRITS